MELFSILFGLLTFGTFKFHYVQMEQVEEVTVDEVKKICLNSTMFRWNENYSFEEL